MSFELAQGLARRTLATDPAADDAERIANAFTACLARAPRPEESQRLLAYLREQQAGFAADPENAKKVAPKDLPPGVEPARGAAWTALARVLINLDEFITRE